MKKLRMKLFGNFELSDGTTTVGELSFHSKKITRLLVYILLHRHGLLTQQHLTEVFWVSDSKNPGNALKNLMYRVRGALKPLGEDEFICTEPNGYRWNPKIEIETDYEEFEQLEKILRGLYERNVSERRECCIRMLKLYQGGVTTVLSDESWMLSKAVWYRSLYLEAVKNLCEIYEKEERWSGLETICGAALEVDNLNEDIYCFFIQALYRQGQYDYALTCYNKALKLFYESLGISQPPKLLAMFKHMMSDIQQKVTGLADFIEDVREKETPKGVMFCDYQIFRQIYRMEARRIDRLGTAEYIMLVTLQRTGNLWKNAYSDQGLTEGVKLLRKSIKDTLRIGDVAAQYSPTQFIILLPMCSYESAKQVSERIRNNFNRRIGMRKMELTFEYEEVFAV